MADCTKLRHTHQADSVLRLMVRGGGRPTMGSGWMRVRLGRVPITYPTCKPFGSWKLIEIGTSFYIETKRQVKLVERYWQLAFQMSQGKFQYLKRKMTVGVTDVLRRITQKWSSNFFDKRGNKQVVVQRMYLGHKGNAKILLKNLQIWKTTLAPHYILYIRSNYGNAQNTWTKHTNLECSWTQNGDI